MIGPTPPATLARGRRAGQRRPDDTGPDSVAVVSGTAGVGKTALAVRFGHQAAKHFPDGQLYISLRGQNPGVLPMGPGEALRFLLSAFGVPPHRITAPVENARPCSAAWWPASGS